MLYLGAFHAFLHEKALQLCKAVELKAMAKNVELNYLTIIV